jgi:hypothetical protein
MGPGIEVRLGELAQAGSLADVQAIVRKAARELVGADGATFVLRDGDRCFYADEDAISPLWKGQRFPIVNCISGWAMLHAETVVVPDIFADERIPHDAYRPTFVKSLMMVPIGQQHPVGAIGTYWACPHEAGPVEQSSIEALAAATADAIARIGLGDAPSLPAIGDEATLADQASPSSAPLGSVSLIDPERIARDLHDTALQTIFATGLRVQAIASGLHDDALKADLAEVVDLINSAVRELRGAILGLHYGRYAMESLEDAIGSSVALAARALGFTPEVSVGSFGDEVDARVRHHAVAALGEMLSNVARHSGATQASVSCRAEGGWLHLSVADNGHGAGDRPVPGDGLVNLAERAEALGGSFELGRDGRGRTLASWRVPLNSP